MTLLRLIRIEYCLLGAAGVVTGAIVNGATGLTATLPATAAAVFFVAAGCYAFDDYFDLYADLANGRRDRPLVTGRRDRRPAAIVGGVCFVLAAVAAFLAGPAVLAVVAGGGASALAYNRWLQRAYPVKNLLLAGAFPTPLLLGGITSGACLSPALVWCAAVAYVGGLGFEVMIDIADVEGDRASGAGTLSTRRGTTVASRVAAAALSAAGLLLLVPFMAPIDPRLHGDAIYLLAALPAVAGALHIALSLLRDQSPAHVFVLKRRAFVALLFALVAFAVGVLA
ncbi:MAG: UbiA family prenyltransferase [Dehalococcoidia bacterium]|jgi:geranylgeranylglycerol-phosphate geranylgeranyltransferase|nr:UbiA family prenyltransferase [Dehalococcoidia bacterium]